MATFLDNLAVPSSPGFGSQPYHVSAQEQDEIGQVNPPSVQGQANLWLESMLQTPYEVYEIRTFLFWDEGLVSLPVAGPSGTPVEIARLSGGQGEKIVAWFGRRKLLKVQAPEQEDDTDRQVFAGEQIALNSARLQADGMTWVYVFAGFYRYLLAKRVSPNVGDLVSFGAPPYAVGDPSSNVFSPGDLTGGITVPQS